MIFREICIVLAAMVALFQLFKGRPAPAAVGILVFLALA